MPPDVNRPSLSINKAAELCDVSRRTIQNWIAKGLVEHFRLPSGIVRIYRDSLILDPETGVLRSKRYLKNLGKTKT